MSRPVAVKPLAKAKPPPINTKTSHGIWLVCEQCYEKRPFSSDDYIQTVEILSSKIPA